MTDDRRGPIDRARWPERLTARVVDSGPTPRILGYAVADDLAPNYGFAEWLFLLATARLPESDEGRAFELALLHVLPGGAGDAATHGASLARLSRAHPKNVVAIAACATAEWAAAACDPNLIVWLRDRSSPFPESALAGADEPLVGSLRGLLPPRHRAHPIFDRRPTLEAAVVAILFDCGVERVESLVLVLTVARLAGSGAEALATPPLSFRDYPMTLPPFEYEETET